MRSQKSQNNLTLDYFRNLITIKLDNNIHFRKPKMANDLAVANELSIEVYCYSLPELATVTEAQSLVNRICAAAHAAQIVVRCVSKTSASLSENPRLPKVAEGYGAFMTMDITCKSQDGTNVPPCSTQRVKDYLKIVDLVDAINLLSVYSDRSHQHFGSHAGRSPQPKMTQQYQSALVKAVSCVELLRPVSPSSSSNKSATLRHDVSVIDIPPLTLQSICSSSQGFVSSIEEEFSVIIFQTCSLNPRRRLARVPDLTAWSSWVSAAPAGLPSCASWPPLRIRFPATLSTEWLRTELSSATSLGCAEPPNSTRTQFHCSRTNSVTLLAKMVKPGKS